jgi:hypothetical protein
MRKLYRHDFCRTRGGQRAFLVTSGDKVPFVSAPFDAFNFLND